MKLKGFAVVWAWFLIMYSSIGVSSTVIPRATVQGPYSSNVVAISPEGAYVLVGADQDERVVFARADGTVLWTYALPSGTEMESGAISSDASLVVIGGQGSSIFVLSKAGQPLWQVPSIVGECEVAVSNAGDRVFVATHYGLYCYGSSGNHLWTRTPNLRGWGAWGLSTTPAGDKLLIQTNSDAILYDGYGNETGFYDIVAGNHVTAAVLSRDGNQFAVGYVDTDGLYYAALYSTSGVRQWRHAVEKYVEVGLDRRGRVFATTSTGKNYLWDNGGSLLASWEDGGTDIAVDEDGNRCIVGRVGPRSHATVYAIDLGDLDWDADADLADFAVFQACFSGPNHPPAQVACSGADLDADGDVDLMDFTVFQACFNGPNRPPASP